MKRLNTLSYSATISPITQRNVRKGSAERGNHLLRAFAPLLLTGKKIEFNRIKGREIVHPIDLTLINDFPDETTGQRFPLKSSLLRL